MESDYGITEYDYTSTSQRDRSEGTKPASSEIPSVLDKMSSQYTFKDKNLNLDKGKKDSTKRYVNTLKDETESDTIYEMINKQNLKSIGTYRSIDEESEESSDYEVTQKVITPNGTKIIQTKIHHEHHGHHHFHKPREHHDLNGQEGPHWHMHSVDHKYDQPILTSGNEEKSYRDTSSRLPLHTSNKASGLEDRGDIYSEIQTDNFTANFDSIYDRLMANITTLKNDLVTSNHDIQ